MILYSEKKHWVQWDSIMERSGYLEFQQLICKIKVIPLIYLIQPTIN